MQFQQLKVSGFVLGGFLSFFFFFLMVRAICLKNIVLVICKPCQLETFKCTIR